MSSSDDLPSPAKTSLIGYIKSQHMTPLKPTESLNLSGKTGIIIGATSGIGRECSNILAGHNLSRLILGARDKQKAENVVKELKRLRTDVNIEAWHIDLLSYDSIVSFVHQCNSLHRIDFVILSSAIVSPQYWMNHSTGHEKSLQVNYLSTCLIVFLLLPILKAKNCQDQPPHLTMVGTSLAYSVKFPRNNEETILSSLDDPAGWNTSVSFERYKLSKLLLIMFLVKIKDYVDPKDLIINIADPGTVKNTALDRELPWIIRAVTNTLKIVIGRSLTAAAWAYVDAAVVKGAESHGSYIMNWQIHP